MSKMKEYDLFIPTSYNSGLPVELGKLEEIRDDLINKFRGLSVFPDPCDGYWRQGLDTFEDQNLVYRVIAEDEAEVHSFMLALKSRLQMLLKQQSIFVIIRDVEIL